MERDDFYGRSSCEFETEVVEGVESQRGVLHSSGNPPADLSSKKSNGKCRRPPKKKNGNCKKRGKKRSENVLVNKKKANSCETEAKVAEGVHEEDASHMNGYDADGKSTCESETEVVEGVENQRGALHSLSDPPANLSSKKSCVAWCPK